LGAAPLLANLDSTSVPFFKNLLSQSLQDRRCFGKLFLTNLVGWSIAVFWRARTGVSSAEILDRVFGQG